MFTTKKDVDKHVRTTLAKLRTDNEKSLRGVTISKLYFKIGEFASALQYVSSYLMVKNDSAAAYKIQGQCYEKMNKIDKALKSYQQSLQLDAKQFDLINNTCKLILANEKSISSGQASFWYDFVTAQNYQHESVLKLKLKIMDRDNVDPKQIQDLILSEIMARPIDVSLRIHLVKHYLEQDRIQDAFRYVYDIEMKQNEFFTQSLDWYKCISSVLAKCNTNEHKGKWAYWLLSVLTLERQCFLTLCSADMMKQQQNLNLSECAQLLFEFDQILATAASVVLVLCAERELATLFLHHYRGQLCLHAATFLFKRERAQHTQNREVTLNALALLLVAYNCGTSSNDELWLRNSNEATKQLIRLWGQEGAFRCSQAGRTLLSCIDEEQQNNSVMINIRKICTDWTTHEELTNQLIRVSSSSDWRKNLFRMLFSNRDHNGKSTTSHLLNCIEMDEIKYDLPRVSDLDTYEECAQWLRPSSLAQMVYLCIGAQNLADLTCQTFSGLNVSISNLIRCGAETLNQLDIDTFLYATTIQAKRTLEIERTAFDSNNDGTTTAKPKILPFANISSSLATDEQANWWMSAYKVCKNISGEDLAEVRQQLQYGIEAIRGVGGPKMDILICLKLGQIFYKRAQNSTKAVENGFLNARTHALYKFSLHMIKMQNARNNESNTRLFKYPNRNVYEYEKEIDNLAEDAITFIASQYFQNNELDECIDELSNIQFPFATYFISKAYRKMEESNQTPKKNKRIYIDKAKEYLQQTLTLLNHPNADQKHPLRGMVYTDLKQLQHHSSSFNNSLNGMSYAEVSMNESISHRRLRETTISSNVDDLEKLMKQMLETLTFVKEDVSNVRSRMDTMEDKINLIEEQLSKKQDSANVDASGLDEFLHLDDDLQTHSFINNASMYPNYGQQRIHTPNPLITQIIPGVAGTQQPVLNPYNNQYYNNVYQMGMNQYQAALMTAQRPPLVQYPEMSFNPQLADPRNSLLGLLTQQATQQPTQQPQGTTIIPSIPSVQTIPPQPQVTPVLPTFGNLNQPNDRTPQNPNLVRTWNSSFNNAPIEKGPPGNVVITSSEPLPHQTTITTQPALSVTIPSHHIKNTVGTTEPSVSSFQPSPDPSQIISATAHSVTDLLKTDTVPKPFSSTPVSSVPDKLKENSSKSAKVSPFANFSFNMSAPSLNTTNIFGSLTQPPVEVYVSIPVKNATQPELGNTSANKESEDDYVPTAEFAPVIPLPDLVETKTGEEEEIIKFEHRAKLLRYVKESKEWKERGIGNIKVLVNKNDPNKVRLLMRRDQVLKLCCNQMINKDTKFVKLPKNETTLRWFGQDFSENELQLELLAVRFKTAETCTEFHNAILEAQKNMKDQTESESTVAVSSKLSVKKIDELSKVKGFGDQFKPVSGSWNCDSCYLSNKISDLICQACNAPKEKPVKNLTNDKPETIIPKVDNGFGDKFKPKAGAWECKFCYISNKPGDLYCAACESPKDDTVPKKEPKNLLASLTSSSTPKFSFGVPPTGSTASSTVPAAGSTVPAASNTVPATSSTVPATSNTVPATSNTVPASNPTIPTTSSFSFGAFTAMTTNSAPSATLFGNLGQPKAGSFAFGGIGSSTKSPFEVNAPSVKDSASVIEFGPKLDQKENFSFVFKPKSPGKAKSPSKCADGIEDVSDDENIEEENNTYFTPVIPLPDKIEIKTGEEDEEVLYTHRSKLYRFTDGEWKERGLGDVKILRHKQSGKLRVVMRREQIFKICLNHVLNDEVEYKVKDDKSWHFIVNDFTEGEVELMQFCLRFKTSEIAQEFLQAVRDALAGTNNTTTTNGFGDPTDKIAEQNKQNIVKFHLPPEFYNLEKVCSGCRGCDSDNFIFPKYKNINSGSIDDNPLPLEQPIKKFSISKPLIISKPSLTTFSQVAKDNETSRNIFGSVSSETSSQGLFTQLSFTPNPNQTKSIFGNNGVSTTNIFGGKAIFGKPNVEAIDHSSKADDVKKSFSFTSSLKPSIFGQNLFGQSSTTTPALTASFGANNTTVEPVKSFSFGEKLSETTPIFGNLAPKPKDESFQVNDLTITPIPQTQNIFGGATKETNKFTATSIFGSSTITPITTVDTNAPIFSFTAPSSLPATEKSEASLFNDNSLSFASLASRESGSNASVTPNTEIPFKVDTELSFASLAQSTKTFSTTAIPDSKFGFFGLSNANVFSNLQKSDENHDDSTGVDDSNYDPHYEPIIALPDEIVVTTGEEDEQKIFGERAKLYRYDAALKEWKERGVGEMKILYHPVNETYRLLLRREQIFKCVLNHQLSADLSINPMKTSDKAFVWAAHNHSEECHGELEQLSVRFKNVGIAEKFIGVINSCMNKLKAKGDGFKPEDD